MGKFGKTARLVSMLGLTGGFFLVEISVGYMTNSMALVADSFHMLSDLIALIIGLLSVGYASCPPLFSANNPSLNTALSKFSGRLLKSKRKGTHSGKRQYNWD